MFNNRLEEGQGLAEYGLVIIIIAIGVIVIVIALGDEISRLFIFARDAFRNARQIGLPDNSPLLNGVIQH